MTRIRVTRPGQLILDLEISVLLSYLWLAHGSAPRLPYTIEVTILDGQPGNLTEQTQVTEEIEPGEVNV